MGGVSENAHSIPPLRRFAYPILPVLLLVLSFSGARTRLMEYGDSSPFSSAPRSAQTVQGPPRLVPTHLRRSTLRVDSVGRVHNSEIETHGCVHNPRVSPEGTSLSKSRVEPMRGTSEAQPWVTRTMQNRSPKGWPQLSRSANIEPRTASRALLRLRLRARTLNSYSCSAIAVLVLVIEGLARPKPVSPPSPPIFVDSCS